MRTNAIRRRSVLAALGAVVLSLILVTGALAARGQIVWSHQWSTPNMDATTAVAVVPTGKAPPNDLDVYVAGITDGFLEDSTGTCSGHFDAFVARYRSNGERVWYHRFGTPGDHDDSVSEIVADRNGAYLVGTWDCHLPSPQATFPVYHGFVRRYDRAGNVTFKQLIANASNAPGASSASGVAIAGDAYYVGGAAAVRLQGSPGIVGNGDLFVRKYDRRTNAAVWTRQFGTNGIDSGGAIAVANGTIYLAGQTAVDFADRFYDLVVGLYDTNGRFIANSGKIFGGLGNDQLSRIAVDARAGQGGIYLVGQTNGSLPGAQNSGATDGFILKRNLANTATLWAHELGGNQGLDESASGVAVNNGGVAVAGQVVDHLPGQKRTGLLDGYVRQYTSGGQTVWTRQFGTRGTDKNLASVLMGDVAFGGGALFLGGGTDGEFQNMPGDSDSRLEDAWLLRMDAN